ncbi:MAG: hypothetical protein ABI999_04505 [Acidobacteriota bacterium]
MRIVIISTSLLLLSGLAVLGQGTEGPVAVAVKKTDDFQREKFDTARDPRADLDAAR